jgi:RimJ/RimL family protein N-acetyltransferase
LNQTPIQLETPRLILRPPNADTDFGPWAEMMGDADTVAFLWNNQVLDPAQAWGNLVMNIGHWQVRGYGFFSVICKETGQWVGRVGPYFPEGWPAPEIGWAVHPAHTRKGYGKEAALASLHYVFEELHWPKVAHVIVPGNEPSIALAKSIGSHYLRKTTDASSGRERLIYGQDRP